MDMNQETNVGGLPPQSSPPARRRRYSGAYFFGILLITLGLVFLLDNMGVISWDAWDAVFRLWPVLLIAGGLDNLINRDGIVRPVFTIGLGTILLLCTLGYLTWSAWYVILTMWPLLLVAIGLDILVGRRSIWWGLLGGLAMVVMLAGTLWILGVEVSDGAPAGQAVEGQVVTQTLDGAEQVDVTLKPAVGGIRIDALPETGGSGILVMGTVRPGKGETVKMDYAVVNSVGEFSLYSEGFTVIYPVDEDRSSDWDLDFSTQIPLDMSASLNVGDLILDLQDIQLDRLNVTLLIGDTTVTLPDQGDFSASVTGLIGDMVIIIPEGMALRIEESSLIGDITTPADFVHQGDTYATPGYENAVDRIDLTVSQLIGEITVRYK